MSPLEAIAARAHEYDLAHRRKRISAIYFLVDNGEIVYVGQTEDLELRVEWHIKFSSKKTKRIWTGRRLKNKEFKRFDRMFWIGVRSRDLDAYEGALIRALKPRYNRQSPSHVGRDNEILAKLGLPIHEDEQAAAIAWLRLKPHSRRAA